MLGSSHHRPNLFLETLVLKGGNVSTGADSDGRRTLLVIDDDVEWTDLLKVFFSKKYNVAVANDAGTALESIESNRPQAIILDLVMPSVDGFGFMHRIGQMSLGAVPTVL